MLVKDKEKTIKKLKLLVAEGNQAERKALSRTLSSIGHDVEAATSGRAAIKKIKSGRFDIAFLAKEMPDMDGFEALEETRARGLDTVVIVTAARLSLADAARAIHKGAYDYLVKPLKPQEVEIALLRVLKRQGIEKLRERIIDDFIRTGRFFQDILENIQSGIWVTDREDTVIYFNRAMEKISGVKRASVLGKNFFKRFSSTLKRTPELAEHHKRARSSLEIVSYDSLRIVHKDGRDSIQSGVMFPMTGDGSRFEGMIVTVDDITDRKKAEEELKEALARFETAIEETLLIATQGYDRRGRIQHWNRASEMLYGFKKEEVMGKKIQRLPLPDNEARDFERDIKSIWETGKPSKAHEWRIVTKSGETRWVYSTMFPRISHNEVVEVFCMEVDTTDRKKAEDEIRKFKTISDKANYGVAIVDLKGNLIYINEYFADIHGYKPGELIGKNLRIFHNDEQLEHVIEINKKLQKEGSYNALEVWHKHKNGSVFPMLMSGAIIKDEEDKPLFMAATAINITEHKKAEEDLQESEKRFKDIASNVGDWIWEVDAQGRYTYSSPTVEQVLGYTPAEIIGKHYYDFFHPAYREKLKAEAKDAFKKKGAFKNFFNPNVHKNGNTVILETSGVPIVGEDGTLLGYRGADRDVTEHKRAEEELRDSEERYHAIFEQAADSIVLIDAEAGSLIDFNERAHENLGYTREEFKKIKLSDIEVLESAEEVAEHIDKIIKEGSDAFETKHRTKSGEIRDIQVSVRPISLRGKLFIQGIWRDITKRKKAEEELRDGERFLFNIFSSIQDGISILDKDMNITRVNLTLEKWYSHNMPLVGKKCYEAYHCRTSPCEVCPTIHTLKTSEAGHEEVPKTGPRGELVGWLDLYSFPLVDAETGEMTGVIEYVRDITKRKKLEKELIHAEKMAGVGQLAAGIAHEFNNFLTMISGYSQLAKAGTLEDKEKAIDVADKVTQRAKIIVKNLTSFAREDKPKKRPADMAEVIEEALAPLSTQIKSQGITIKRHYSPVPIILCDAGQIRQVLFNIALNAVHAMENGGDLVISLYPENEDVIIKVADTGYGIPEEILEKIFDPFVTTKGAISEGEISGSGLGLSVSYGLIKEHGGNIVAENNPDGGATFTIRLPALKETPPPATRTAPPAREGEDSTLKTKARIMVIDDEEVILDLLTEILQKKGERVTAVKDPQVALSILRRESYDIIFLDLVMPGNLRGLGLLREIKKIAPSTKIVLLTGKDIDEEIKATLEETACDFINKPFSVEEINGIIEAALKKRAS